MEFVERALRALGSVVPSVTDDRDDGGTRGSGGEEGSVRVVDPDDEFWGAETYAGDEASAGDLDDCLYE